MKRDRKTGNYTLTEQNGTVYSFNTAGLLQTVTDNNGNSLSYSYSDGKLSGIRHSGGQTLDITRNADGTIATITDSTGQVLHYIYDNGDLVGVSEEKGGTAISYAYSDTLPHAMTSATGIDGNSLNYTYNERGLLSSLSSRDGAYQAVLDYGENGEVIVTDTQGGNVTYRYGLDGRLFHTVDNAI